MSGRAKLEALPALFMAALRYMSGWQALPRAVLLVVRLQGKSTPLRSLAILEDAAMAQAPPHLAAFENRLCVTAVAAAAASTLSLPACQSLQTVDTPCLAALSYN